MVVKVLKDKREGGGIIPLVALIIFAAFGLVALLVDTSREEISVTEIQSAADAAALAAARRLSGTEDGWRAAKRAAIAVLKKDLRNIRGVDNSEINSLSLRSGELDSREAGSSPYQGTEGDVGNVHVTIERGVFWASGPGTKDMQFRTLEEKLDNQEDQFGLPAHLIANAVRVEIRLNDFATTFAKVFGVDDIGSLRRESTAVFDTQLEECVFPVAVTACSLMMDINADRPAGSELNNGSKYQTEQFQAGQTCQREIIATEVDPKGLDKTGTKPATLLGVNEKRVEGFIRAESYYRYPYENVSGNKKTICFPERGVNGETLNCLAVPIAGVFGVPSLEGIDGAGNVISSQAARTADVADAISNLCVPARLGAQFKPLENPYEGLYDNEFLSVKLAAHINSADTTISQVFGTDANTKSSNKYPNVRTAQFVEPPKGPKDSSDSDSNLNDDERLVKERAQELRDLAAGLLNGDDASQELRLQWPAEEGTQSFLMSDMLEADQSEGIDSTEQWGNPMCHDARIVNVDTPAARAREVTIMVIASASDKAIHPYCDFNSAINHNTQESFAPMAGTAPVIVGFKKAYIYDFNFSNLETEPYGGETGSPSFNRLDPVTYEAGVRRPLKDNNPAQRDPLAQGIFGKGVNPVQTIIEDHLSWVECVKECGSSQDGDCGQCRAKAEEMENIEDLLAEIELGYSECFNDPVGPLADLLERLKPKASADWLDLTDSDMQEICKQKDGLCIKEVKSRGECDGQCEGYSDICKAAWNPEDEQAFLDVLTNGDPSPGGDKKLCPNLADAVESFGYPPKIDLEKLAKEYENILNDPNLDLSGWGTAIPNTHCLPRKLQNCWEDSARCWEAPKPRRSGWGCGGARMRLSCGDGGGGGEAIPSTKALANVNPGLVN